VKDPSAFTFRGDDLENRIPSARQLVYADARANPRGRLPDDTWLLRPQDLAGCLTPQEDTWYFPRVAGTFKERAGFHGCQMPEQLLGRIIRTCSNRGDLVLDPFSGSATTLVVAKKLGRRYMGIEISDEYVRRGTDRLAAVRLDDPLEGAPEPTLSVPCTPVPGTAFRKRRHRSKSAQRRPSERHVNDSAIDCAPAVQDGLISAFRSTHGGYSLDRLIADPDVNDRFVEACCKLGLPGDARSWNRLLLRMRKAGKLAEVATRERTDFHWDDCDPYLFASEIALQQILNRGCESVDALLCDPFTSTEFDRLAQSLAPGFSSLQFRWATLKLRKEAKLARARTRVLTPVRLGPPIPLSELDFRSIPQVAGVYLVTGTGGKPKLYAGGTLNLCRRLSCKFSAPLLTQWRQQWSADLILLATLPESGAADVLAYQYLLAREHRPSLNCLEFADGDENGRQRFDRSQVDSKRKNRKRSESRSMSFHG
jgi:site-specific DNA-methyltransferase (adenine-specific)